MRGRAGTVAALLLAVTFAVGGLTGMVLEEALGLDWFEFLDEDYDEADDRLLAALELSRSQRAQAEEILQSQENRLAEYWEGRLPEIQAILRQSYDEIRAILDAGQRERFDRRVRELGGRVPREARD